MKKWISLTLGLIILFSLCIIGMQEDRNASSKKYAKVTGTILEKKKNQFVVQDSNHIIYTIKTDKQIKKEVGEDISLEYTGLLNKNKTVQKVSMISYKSIPVMETDDGIPIDWMDNGIFQTFYILANKKLKNLSLDEKIGQILLGRFDENTSIKDLEKYPLGGFVFFERDFKNKEKNEVVAMIKTLQEKSKIPLLTAVDEEGGVVVRVSSNPKLASERFKSSQDLYRQDGFTAIKKDTVLKSKVLNELGLNLNLAPVVDVATSPSAYMYNRTLGEDTEKTSEFSKTVISASKDSGVSYTLKHFPGYGNNADTHTGTATDNRSYDDILDQDLPPFKAGIEVGAEAVLVSHNVVTSIDSNNPASLSKSNHNLLRNELGFTGIIITDDLDMGATSSISNKVVKALLAGNDMAIVTDYKNAFAEIKESVDNGKISEELINKLAFRVLAWKYYKGLLFSVQK